MKSTYETGLRGEELAADYLHQKFGMICLEHRYRTKHGEIDLIMLDGDTIVFVEVKKRSGIDDAAYAILPQQQQRIWRAAENFIKNNPQFDDFDVRFDAFLVSSKLSFRHITDAWRK